MGKIMLGLKSCLLSAVAGTLLLTVGGCAKKAKKEFKERETRVTIQELEQRTFRERIPLQGIISPKEYAMISAKISGTLELLKVSEGDRRKAAVDKITDLGQVTVKAGIHPAEHQHQALGLSPRQIEHAAQQVLARRKCDLLARVAAAVDIVIGQLKGTDGRGARKDQLKCHRRPRHGQDHIGKDSRDENSAHPPDSLLGF